MTSRHVEVRHSYLASSLSQMPPLMRAYQQLLDHFGPQHWWPGESPTEIVVGAVLVQNTAWRNVERAMQNLRDAGVMDVQALYQLPAHELAELIRPAGYYQVKTRRLRNLLHVIVDQYGGSLATMFEKSLPTLRQQLLSVHGIGPETADAILLYAGGMPTFVVDAYTHRILARHGWIDFSADYHQIKDLFEFTLPTDPAIFNEFHALLVQVGKDFCKRSVAKCAECPLADLLPPAGIVAPD